MNYDKKKSDLAKKSKLIKVHHSVEHCRHCGKVVSKSTRHESGHREYDHERRELSENSEKSR